MSKFGDETSEYDLRLVRETDRAYCVRDDEGADIWLPKSKVDCEDARVGAVCTFTVPNWLAEENDLPM